MILSHMNEHVKHVFDAAAWLVALGALVDVLPKVAAGLSVLWLGIQIYDRVRYGPKGGRG